MSSKTFATGIGPPIWPLAYPRLYTGKEDRDERRVASGILPAPSWKSRGESHSNKGHGNQESDSFSPYIHTIPLDRNIPPASFHFDRIK